MRSQLIWVPSLLLSTLVSAPAAAHFLWVVTESEDGATKVKVYFAETAEPDDPALLERFGNLEPVVLAGWRNEPHSVRVRQKEGHLETDLTPAMQVSAVVLRHNYGVITRGGEPFLLNYYAKTYPYPLPGSWRPVANQEQLPLEIQPHAEASGAVSFRVTWLGNAVPGATVNVQGPGIDTEGVTDEKGRISCQLPQGGLFSVRARHIEPVAGERDGQKYASIRHYSTLTLRYAKPQLNPATAKLPDLPQGITSFGGAVLGNAVYVYGGNYGDAHEYSDDGQSGDLWQLDLGAPTKWQRVMSGIKLQGLAMVEYGGSLYRIGGFRAMNKEGDEQDLHSQRDFARFVPGKVEWESLPDLPEARSSHDAAVLGDTLYGIGGWNLRGRGQETKWHDAAYKVDLSAATIAWKPIAAPPFKRRALAVAAWQGKLYCIGGMTEREGTTTAVAVYDPRSNSWSEQPRILGGSMDGFGARLSPPKGRYT